MTSRFYTRFAIVFLLFFSLEIAGQSPCAINIAPDTITICTGQSVTLPATGTGSIPKWTPGTALNDSKILNPVANPTTTTKYVLENIKYNGVDLITNGDFEQGSTGFTSQYTGDCNSRATWGNHPYILNEKFYCVTDSSGKFTGLAGWKNCKNHTVGGNKLMVVNGATKKDETVWCQQITNIQPNTDYEFSTWVTTIYPTNPAVLQFTINNVKLDQPFNASPITDVWNQFYSIWNSGQNTSANICITNQNTQSNGNDFALDDISFKAVCRSKDSVVVEVLSAVKPKLGDDLSICPGDTVVLNSSLSPSIKHTWNTSATSSIIKVDQPGTYIVEADIKGCTGKDTLIISELPTPVFTLDVDSVYCFPLIGKVILGSNVSAKSYLWWTGTTDVRETVSAPGTFWLTLSNGKNCTYSDTVTIKGACTATSFHFPNAFTPNEDGINDKYTASGENIMDYKMMIFNRWGELLYESSDINLGWDGTYKKREAPADLYVARFSYFDIDPKTMMKRENKVFSTVTLLR